MCAVLTVRVTGGLWLGSLGLGSLMALFPFSIVHARERCGRHMTTMGLNVPNRASRLTEYQRLYKTVLLI